MTLNIVFGDGSRTPYIIEKLNGNELAEEIDRWSKDYYLTIISIPTMETERIINIIAYEKRALNMSVNEDKNV